MQKRELTEPTMFDINKYFLQGFIVSVSGYGHKRLILLIKQLIRDAQLFSNRLFGINVMVTHTICSTVISSTEFERK